MNARARNLKTLVAALSVCLAAGAHAANATLTDLDPGAGVSFSHIGTGLGSVFSDTLTFTLDTTAPQWNAAGGAWGGYRGIKVHNFVWGQGLTTLNVSIFGSSHSDNLGSFVLGTTTLAAVIPLQLVASGTYTVVISGTTRDAALIPGAPSYSFSLSAAPVPEPGEWAMIMAGLGMIGLMTRRRKQVN